MLKTIIISSYIVLCFALFVFFFAEPLYGVKTLILRDNTFDVFGVTGLLRIIAYDNALVKLNLKCCFLHAWMGQLLAAIACK